MNIELLLEDFCHYSSYIRGVSPMTVKRYREKIKTFYKVMNIQDIEEVSEQITQNFFLHGRVKRQWKTAT
ncbi:MAG: hypothetical protein GKR88_13850 [Flavobacteriaceae bacterium]|nr:MAG: hypothetical protein GKR88_13850 [Flavobacteriaceae bacterium]